MEQACPLHLAAKVGFVEGVIRLLEGYANLEAVDKNGLTPLLIGCREGKVDVVSVLIEAGANVNHISFVSIAISMYIQASRTHNAAYI